MNNSGRPRKKISSKRLLDTKTKFMDKRLSIRKATELYNEDLPVEQHISKSKMATLLSDIKDKVHVG